MSDRDPDEPADDDWEWEYTLDDLAEREAEAEAAEAAQERRSEPVEAGSPSPEGIVFVLLGVLLTVFVLWRLVAG